MSNLKIICKLLEDGENVFLTGGAGVGKSYTLNQIIKSNKFKCAVLASTALAAYNIGGDTVHRFFKFRLAKSLKELRTSKKDLEKLNNKLKKIDLIIIDEISMISADVFTMIAARLASHRHIRLLVVGDFYQLEPVNSNSDYAFSSLAWLQMNFKIIELQKQFRCKDEQFYAKLKALRVGQISQEEIKFFEQFWIKDERKIEQLSDFTIICGTNAEASAINEQRLASIDAPLLHYEANCKIHSPINEKELENWKKTLPIEENFFYKVGAKVIFTCNYESYFNGMQGEITRVDKEHLYVKSGGFTYCVKPKEFKYYEDEDAANDGNEKSDASVFAYPLKLAYAITIHKSQGMSIERLICKCDRIFAAGQLYVAISRASEPRQFFIQFARNSYAFSNLFYEKSRANYQVSDFYNNSSIERL